MEHNDLFQIGEVSRLFHISVSTLRHYEKIGLVKPEYTDSDSRYRYYSTRQFERLNTIRYLRALNMPLNQIAAFLENRDTGTIQELLLKQQAEVKRQQTELAVIERKIANRLEQIADALSSELETIKIVTMPKRRIASIKRNLLPHDNDILEYTIRLLEEYENNTVTFLGKIGVGITAEKLLKQKYQPYDIVFLLLDEEDQFKGPTTVIPAETCAVIRFKGSHEQAAVYYDRLMQYITDHHCRITGFSKEITMIDDGLTNDRSKFVTEIQIPVEKVSEG